ncbi:predicted protein [Chaetoceros tenuissimus]|uniref:Uncharacterized protein n=1 Tax=Chaetoceros tenuissimus TaxID=426638 RepID=A0AAD3HAI5_9STRA|nr:predicted protein [Chaetoceros tenuissimus]
MIASFNQVEGSCADDENFKFLLTGTNYKWIKKCSFISNNEKREEHCKYGHVQGGCPFTCGECECQDDPGFTFVLAKTQEIKDCSWITRNKKKTHIRRLRYCFPGSPYFGDGVIGRHCKNSCGFCSATYDTTPEEENSLTVVPTDASNQTPSPSPTLNLPEETSDEEDFNFCPNDIHDNTSFHWKLNKWKCSKLIESTDENVTKRRRASNCVIHEVMANCPHACAICCDDNPEFRFETPDGRQKACAYITNNPDEDVIKKRQNKFCYSETKKFLLENCSRQCVVRRKKTSFIVKTPSCGGVRG